jgi:hypothetical protein
MRHNPDVGILALFLRCPHGRAVWRVRVRRNQQGRIIAAACFCLAIAGCGSPGTAAKPPTTVTTTKVAATPSPTAATPELANYAVLAQPVVRSGITQVTLLLKEMKSGSLSQLGRTCSTAGGTLSSNRDAFTTVSPPLGAKKLYSAAKHGYSIMLGATDECGIASDSNSSSALATAAQDLQTGLRQLISTQSTLVGWAAKH